MRQLEHNKINPGASGFMPSVYGINLPTGKEVQVPRIAIKDTNILLSQEDIEWAASRPWHISDTGYVRGYSGTPGKAASRMHRLIVERKLARTLLSDELVDHINHNKLDNRRSNLRIATKSTNGMNSRPRGGHSPYIGVCKKNDRPYKCWMAYLNLDGTRFLIGNFYSELEAAWMRDQYALALHGEFASLNFEYLPTKNVNEERED
jgi:hypothetical protein